MTRTAHKKYGLPSELRPDCVIVGEDGNVFAIIGRVTKALRGAGFSEKAVEIMDRVTDSEFNSYAEVLVAINDYINPS